MTRLPRSILYIAMVLATIASLSVMSGCGATKASLATEQLLMSGAVDSTIAQIDFRPLAGKKIFLDTTYLSSGKLPSIAPNGQMVHNLVNSDYVASSLRQQLMAAGCYLKENKADAEIICEARIGALGTDGHSVTIGVPASNALNSAASIFSNSPALPSIPEIALAKREQKAGAAKVAVFAYNRETAEPVWQSGVAQANSTARDMWVLGIGPMQSGTIYKGSRFAGDPYRESENKAPDAMAESERHGVDFQEPYLFVRREGELDATVKPPIVDKKEKEPVVAASASDPAPSKTPKR